jgi:AAA+ superfamily predicted ATPase
MRWMATTGAIVTFDTPSNASLEETVKRLEHAIDEGGSDAPALRVHLVSVLNQAARYAEAWTVVRDAVLDDPGDLTTLELAGAALRGLGRDARATRYEALAERLSSSSSLPVSDVRATATQQGGVAPVLQLVPARASDAGTITLRDVFGMEKVKRRLELSFLGPLKNPQLRQLYGKSLRGGLLLWGPPGCGKTFLAKAIAGELGAHFMSIGLDDVLDMYTGQSERNISTLFATARRRTPCVLFFDEIDALGQKRGNLRGASSRNLVVQLLSELDGVDSQNEGLFVLGATNHPWDVDTALRRPGRFDRTVLVLPPDEGARRAIIAKNLADRPTEDIDTPALVRQTSGFSGADLVYLCEAAAEVALADAIDSGNTRAIAQRDFVAALGEVRSSTDDWFGMARNYAEFASESRDAYAELLAYLKSHRKQ